MGRDSTFLFRKFVTEGFYLPDITENDVVTFNWSYRNRSRG